MSLAFKISNLDPSQKTKLMGELNREFLAVWRAMDLMDWGKLDEAMTELERRATIALLDIER